MAKKKLFSADFEIHASIKMLYPYIQTAGGLSEWFADDVRINNLNKTLTFFYDSEQHIAKLAAQRPNHFVRYEFLPVTEEDKNDPPYFELRLEFNDLTQSVYLKVIDYSDFDNERDQHELWEGLIDNLKKTVGG